MRRKPNNNLIVNDKVWHTLFAYSVWLDSLRRLYRKTNEFKASQVNTF